MSEHNFFVHPSADVDEPCDIGAGTKIWHFCHVMAGARLGERCNAWRAFVESHGLPAACVDLAKPEFATAERDLAAALGGKP